MNSVTSAQRRSVVIQQAVVGIAGIVLAPAMLLAQETIQYHLSFPEAHTHYVEVEAIYPTAGKDHLELLMAVWTPGSYLVREYARHIEALERSPALSPEVANRKRARGRGAPA